MHILQRYILRELLRVLLLIVSAVTVLLVFVGVFREATESGLGPLQAVEILPYVVPSMLPFTVPATLLLTVCVVYGRLAADFEITAAKAAGVNVLSLLSPAFLLGTILSVCSLLLSDQVIPWSVGKIQQIITLAMEDIFLDLLSSQNLVNDTRHGIAITVTRVDREERRLIKPNIRYCPRGGEPIIIQADEATLNFDLEQQVVVLKLKQAWIDAPGSISGKLDDKEFSFPLMLASRNATKPRHLDLRQIKQQLSELQREMETTRDCRAIESAFALAMGDFQDLGGPRFHKLESQLIAAQSLKNKHSTELHNRFALSCSCFFFALLGSPVSILLARREFLMSFICCFLPILLGYYPVVLLMLSLSKTGAVNPAWAMWVGNVLLLVASGVILRKAIQH